MVYGTLNRFSLTSANTEIELEFKNRLLVWRKQCFLLQLAMEQEKNLLTLQFQLPTIVVYYYIGKRGVYTI